MYRPIQVVLWSGVILCCIRTGAAHDDVANISEAVLLKLLPYINDIKDGLRYMKNDLTHLNKTVSNLSVTVSDLSVTVSHLSGDLEEYKTQTTSELAGLQNMFNVSFTSHTEQLSHLNGKMDIFNASMREDLRAMDNQLKEKMASEVAGLQRNMTVTLHTSFQSSTRQLTTKVDTLDSKLASVNASTRKEFRAMESQLEEHRQQTTSKLAGLQSNITSTLNTTNIQLQTTKMELSTKVDTLDSKLVAVNASIREDLSCIKKNLSTTMNKINDQLAVHEDHMTTELMELDQNLEQNFTLQLKNSYGYITPYQCGDTGGWRRVVYLNMTDPNTNCPSGWDLWTQVSKRTCRRTNGNGLTCDSVNFPVSGGDYTRVCGRIKAFQYRATDGFQAYHEGRVTTIDGAYVSGVSLTHGSPRQHIWTFAAGAGENQPTRIDVCPCDATTDITIPPFVGGDYFCESGWNSGRYIKDFYSGDPLWDGDGCTASSTCCSFNNPPYFTKQLPSPTTDDIEARVCRLEGGEDTPIELIELYVQ